MTVKALAGESTPTGGDVEFKIKQMGVKDDIAEEAYTKPLENGKAQLQLAKKNFDFSGEYLITAAYKDMQDIMQKVELKPKATITKSAA